MIQLAIGIISGLAIWLISDSGNRRRQRLGLAHRSSGPALLAIRHLAKRAMGHVCP